MSTGPTGIQGQQGRQGIFRGLAGQQGDRGITGPQGPQGQQGQIGSSTSTGPIGATGITRTINNNGPNRMLTFYASDIYALNVLRYDGSTLTVGAITTATSLQTVNGSASLPSYSFSNDLTTGMFLPASNSFAISVAGTEDIRILSNGNVGIGLTNPSFQLQLSTDSAAKLTTNTWSTTSDSRVKNAIVDADISMCYDTLKQLKLRRFEWDSSWNSAIEDKHAIGFIAQEVKQYFPKAVKTMDMYGYSDFHPLDVDQIYKTMYGALAKLIQEKELLEERARLLKGASM